MHMFPYMTAFLNYMIVMWGLIAINLFGSASDSTSELICVLSPRISFLK